MADGSNNIEGFIAYQDEEHGLGFRVASHLASPKAHRPHAPSGDKSPLSARSYRLTTPRRTTAETLASLIANDAWRAVVPLQNDRRGYDKQTLSTLIDFQDYEIAGEQGASDKYVLAVPTAMVEEQAESSFPSAYKAGAVGSLANGRAAQTAIRRRIGTIYASPDALDRCGAAIDGFRAQGIGIERLAEHANAYTDVLSEAYSRLDPERTIQTSFSDRHDTLKRTSEIKGRNYGKPLVGVLLPLDMVTLGDHQYDPEKRDTALQSDYVIVDQDLAGGRTIETHFLVLKRKKQKTGVEKKKSHAPAQDKIAGTGDSLVNSLLAARGTKNVRLLLKVDTRGEGVKDTAPLAALMTELRLRHTPVVLNDRPDTLPTIYEISLEDDADRDKLHKVLKKAFDTSTGWQTRVLGAYLSDRSMPEPPEPAKPNSNLVNLLMIGAGALGVAILSVLAVREDVRAMWFDFIGSAF